MKKSLTEPWDDQNTTIKMDAVAKYDSALVLFSIIFLLKDIILKLNINLQLI